MAAVASPAGDPDGRHRARRDRPDPARHADPRLLDALDGGARQGGDRQHAGCGDGRRGRLFRVRVRVLHGPRLHHERAREARPRHRGRAADAVPRLHRPEHLHPVRRRRRRGRAVGVGRAGRRPRDRADDRAAGRLHDLAAGRRGEEPAVGRDDRARRALHPDGGQGDLPVRDADARVDRARSDRAGRASSRPTSTCSSRTRPTSGSSRPSPRASTCRWTGCSSTSTSTATRRRRRCRSRSPRPSTRAGSRSATGSSSWRSGPGFTSRRGRHRVDRRPGARDRRRRGRQPRGRPACGCRSTGIRSTRSRDALAALMAQPGHGRRAARRRRARANPEHAVRATEEVHA